MTLKEIKIAIESNNIPSDLLIFKNSESSLIANQYTQAIARKKNLDINYISSLQGVLQNHCSLFTEVAEETDNILYVYQVDVLKDIPSNIYEIRNLIIITNKIENKENEELLKNYIISVPKIEDWQWKDYVYSLCEGVPTENLDWFINICKDKNRCNHEINKVSIFNINERKYLFEDLIRDGMVDDLTSNTVFTFSQALSHKKLDSLLSIIPELHKIDINEFGLMTILLKNFKNLINVQLSPNPTAESCGLDSRQFYAIKKSPKVYSAEQLSEIYSFLCDLDRKIKLGEMPVELLIDYIIIKVLTI